MIFNNADIGDSVKDILRFLASNFLSTGTIRCILMYQSRKSQRKYDVSMQGHIRIGKIPMIIPKTIRKLIPKEI